MNFIVFYAGLLYGEYAIEGLRLLQVQGELELYNGGYVYNKRDKRWYRMDGTPVLNTDVPPNLKALLLLLL
jgi:hypothetical protein